MAPEAESKVRRRREQEKVAQSTSSQQERIISTVHGLKNNEVAIDGIIYDLDSFDHPGGSTIGVFGGNDVTVQYKMIHAHHSNNNDKHLEKMKKVGRLVDYTSE
jgi:cytochrome b involved in lipid metabolism